MKKLVLLFPVLMSSMVQAKINSSAGCIVYDEEKNIVFEKEVLKINDLNMDYIDPIKTIVEHIGRTDNREIYLENKKYGLFDIVIQALESDHEFYVIRLDLRIPLSNYHSFTPKSYNKLEDFKKLLQEKISKTLGQEVRLADKYRSADCTALEFVINEHVDFDLKVHEVDGKLELEHIMDYGAVTGRYQISNPHYISIAKRILKQKGFIK